MNKTFILFLCISFFPQINSMDYDELMRLRIAQEEASYSDSSHDDKKNYKFDEDFSFSDSELQNSRKSSLNLDAEGLYDCMIECDSTADQEDDSDLTSDEFPLANQKEKNRLRKSINTKYHLKQSLDRLRKKNAGSSPAETKSKIRNYVALRKTY